MKRIALIGILAALMVVGMVGCDWETGDSATSWSSAFNWVNFSGTYRPLSGGTLVSAYSTVNTPETVVNEYQGSFIAGQASFSGALEHGFVVSNSFVLSFYNYKGVEILTIADNGNGELGIAHTELTPVIDAESGTQVGTDVLDYIESLGSIQYVSGAWSVSLTEGLPAKGTIRATYSYAAIPSAALNQANPAVGVVSGTTGESVHTFVVKHSGQHLTLTDNNGASYTGYISEMRSSSGWENTDIEYVAGDETSQTPIGKNAKLTYQESALPPVGDMLIASFECTGVSAAGYNVTIAGVLQGQVGNYDIFPTGQQLIIENRQLTGTWIEDGGTTGDISGWSDPVYVPASTVTGADIVGPVPAEYQQEPTDPQNTGGIIYLL